MTGKGLKRCMGGARCNHAPGECTAQPMVDRIYPEPTLFRREDRYIVIKRKHLTPFKERAIRDQLAALEVSTVECVAVESDWPEYETVWGMIEARVTGKQPALAALSTLPAGCPVKAVGMSVSPNGFMRCHYTNARGQAISLAPEDHCKANLCALFGPDIAWLEANFPRWSKPIYSEDCLHRQLVRPAEIIGFDTAEVAAALIIECTRKPEMHA
ncbi:hypothetical protein [Novosphingobium rosa]|uniref:hypothetical protein n=1 Tax=Novosphingobium rosa TaxID=76978 RepID=UPI000836CFC6|nr:hypothetical protein [Novosphingobium rosa]